VKQLPVKVGMGTVEELTIENMGTAFGILSPDGAEPEIHLRVTYCLRPTANVRFKNTTAAAL